MTYSAMVVEDSKPILRNIAQQIESVHARVRVVATAGNGREALMKLRGARVDIVFSDIKMPVLGGLDFLGEARSQNPGLRCVIISGYDDFEFARQAIQIRVDEYILKPVTKEELRTVLEKIVASLDHGRRQAFQEELSRALKRGETAWHAPNDVLRGPYGICILRCGALRDGPRAPDMADMRATFSRAGSCDGSLFFAETRGHSELAVVSDLEAVSDEAWRGICSRVFESLPHRGQVGRMACSSGHTDVPGLPSYAAFLSQCLEEHVCLDTPTLLWADSRSSEPGMGILRDELARFREEAGLLAGARSVDEFRLRLEDFVRSWRARNLPLIAVRKLLGLIVDAIDECGHDRSPTRDSTVAVEELLGRSESYETLVHELCLLYQAAVERRKDADSSLEGTVQAAIDLFRCNLGRNITMNEVAARLGFSLSYVHRVLRSALGKAPMEYYNDMKLEEAKRLLARYPHRKVKEIAMSLGFENQHYFSRFFKTHISLSPVEYRKQATRAR